MKLTINNLTILHINIIKMAPSAIKKSEAAIKEAKSVLCKITPGRMLDPLSGVQVAIGSQRKIKALAPGSKPFCTAFQLSVYRSSAFSHAVEKRYADFEKLHRLLRAAVIAAASPSSQCGQQQQRHQQLHQQSALKLPELPAKLLGAPGLEAYVNAVLVCLQNTRSTACSSLVCKFLNIEQRSPTHNSSSSSTGCWPYHHQKQEKQQQSLQARHSHAPVVRMPEVELVPRAELDLLTYTVIDTVYQSSGSSSIDD